MTDEEKYAPGTFVVDRAATMRAVAAWREEALRRAREDMRVRMLGRSFQGIEKDPNAAFVVGVMQKHFMVLARDSAVSVKLFPYIRENAPRAVGVLTVWEEALGQEGRESLLILRRICDDVTQKEVSDDDGQPVLRIRFTIHDVWSRYERRGNSYAQWLKLTYG